MFVESVEKLRSLREAVMFLIYKDDKVLLEERKDPHKSYFGYIMIPGGKVEADETPDEAMSREAKEERGIAVRNFVLLDSFEDMSTMGEHYLVHAYLITDFDGQIVNNEAEKADNVWVSLGDAKKTVRFANSRYVLMLAETRLNEEGLKAG